MQKECPYCIKKKSFKVTRECAVFPFTGTSQVSDQHRCAEPIPTYNT